MTRVIGFNGQLVPEAPVRHRASPRFERAWALLRDVASTSRRKSLVVGARALVATIKGRFGIAQVAGGAAASAGVFELWGLGVGLLVTGLSVLVAASALERMS